MIRSATRIWKRRGFRTLVVAAYHRLRSLLVERVLRRPYVARRVHDYTLLLDVSDPGVSRELLLYGTREAEHRQIIARIVAPGMTVLDVGANIGYYTVMMMRLMGGRGRIIAVEPSQDNLMLLRQNIALNGYEEDVVLFPGAVSNTSGKRHFYISDSSNLHSFHEGAVDMSSPDIRVMDVATSTFADIIDKFGAVDLIRMDVEGHEVEILDGIADAIGPGGTAPLILFEAHPTYYSAEHDIRRPLQRLFDAGYFIKYLGSSGRDGTSYIERLGYVGSAPIVTDEAERVIFEGVANRDALHLIGATGSVRSVLLGH